MQRTYFGAVGFVLLLTTSILWARAPLLCQQEAPILNAQGQQKPSLTVRSIIMTPDRESATIAMVNQSEKTITAFGYAYDVTLVDGRHSKGERMQERIGDIVFKEAGMHNNAPLPPDLQPIKPGEIRNEVFLFNEPDKVADFTVTMEVVLYVDQSYESINQQILDIMVASRTAVAKSDAIAVQAISAGMQDEHPVSSAHDRLLKMRHSDPEASEAWLTGAIQDLEGRTFANVDEERKYLAALLAEHQSSIATLTKHAKIARRP
jgi:molecular chaperone DnaK (HSP70)